MSDHVLPLSSGLLTKNNCDDVQINPVLEKTRSEGIYAHFASTYTEGEAFISVDISKNK